MCDETLKFYKRNLPHWIVANKTYFVTIRLHGTLPKAVVKELQEENRILRECSADADKMMVMKRSQFRRIEKILDSKNSMVHYLDDPLIAGLIFNNLGWLKKRGWHIHAATVLSTHIHLLTSNHLGKTVNLLEDLGLYKNFTAREANKILGKTGSFWAREDFDHWIRTNSKFEATVNYIANNPVKAGRVKNWQDWKWTLIDESLIECVK